MPQISVIIPLYNKEAIIERSVRSVLNQSFVDFELIIVNDGSTDKSAGVIQGIRDDRIIFIEQENGGPAKARNTGVNHAKGKWILFLDADDELAEEVLEHFFRIFTKNPTINVIDGSFVVRGNKTTRTVTYNENIRIKNNYKSFFYKEILPSTGHTLFKRSLLERYSYNEIIRRYEDVELIMRLLKEAKIITTSKVIFYVNTSYSAASKARSTIKEDFMGYLDFKNKNFWEKMCLYQFYLWEREYYPYEVRELYPTLHRRYDLLILYKTLITLKKYSCYLRRE